MKVVTHFINSILKFKENCSIKQCCIIFKQKKKKKLLPSSCLKVWHNIILRALLSVVKFEMKLIGLKSLCSAQGSEEHFLKVHSRHLTRHKNYFNLCISLNRDTYYIILIDFKGRFQNLGNGFNHSGRFAIKLTLFSTNP